MRLKNESALKTRGALKKTPKQYLSIPLVIHAKEAWREGRTLKLGRTDDIF